MFNRRKTPRFTGDLWKFPVRAATRHRSNNRAPDGPQPPPNGRTSRHGTISALPRRVSDPDEAPLTAPVNGCAVLRFAAPLRVTGAFRFGMAGSYGRPVIPAGALDATTDELP